MNNQREILERILQGDPMPVAEPEHPDAKDFADFTRYLDGLHPYERRFDKFLPKKNGGTQ